MQSFNISMISVHSSPLARLGGKEAGGMNVYVRELSQELGRRGLHVDIFTRRQHEATPTIQYISPTVRVVNLLAGEAAPYDKYRLLDHVPEFVQRVAAFARENQMRYRLIHSHYWISGDVSLRLRRLWNVPVVQMFHTLGAIKNTVARSVEEAERQQRIAIEQQLLHRVDALVAATPRDRDHMVQRYGADADHITIIPGGVNLDRFYAVPQEEARARLGIPSDQFVMLCVGRMEPLKGMDCLIRALSVLCQRRPDNSKAMRVLLIGGASEGQPDQWNAEQRRLAVLREELGVASHVQFLGMQSQELLPWYHAAADVSVVPSHYESFGLVALEAQACGACVVASDVGGLSYIVDDGHNGLLVPPDDPDALADRLDYLLQHPSYREALGEEGLRRAIKSSWSYVAGRTLCLYHKVVARGMPATPCYECMAR